MLLPMEPFPENHNSPPIVGEVCYYHAPKNKLCLYKINNSPKHYICKIKTPQGKFVNYAVHYSLPEDTGSRLWITRHEGTMIEILNNV